MMFHSTSESCCEAFFLRLGLECNVVQSDCQLASHIPGMSTEGNGETEGGGEGGEGGEGEAECVSLGWHANINTQDGCTDDDQCKLHIQIILLMRYVPFLVKDPN